jgi:glycine hydroxymethyltransferase
MPSSLELLAQQDPDIAAAIQSELKRQQYQIELIASENFVSPAVLAAQGSVLTNKYAEGYSGKRYYGGCEYVDIVENLAISRVTKLFNCAFANVQPHSGSQANQAVLLALLNPGDAILGMDLAAGGHLTHGAKVSLSGKWFQAHHYGVHPETHLIDYDEVARIAEQCRPRLIIAGGSAYTRIIDFERFRAIADAVGAYLMVDMAHFAGLVAAGLYPSPLPHAHVVTSTTHKTLRGPRGGLILTQAEDISKKINSAVFPGIQGGPLMHVIAAKAVAFAEALQPTFRAYAKNVIANAQSLAKTLQEQGISLVSGGTDSHLLLVNLQPWGVTGKQATESLERANITCNKNSIPFDTLSPIQTSGIRLGSPAATTRGFTVDDFQNLGLMISTVLQGLRDHPDDNTQVEARVQEQALALCQRYPLYPELG